MFSFIFLATVDFIPLNIRMKKPALGKSQWVSFLSLICILLAGCARPRVIVSVKPGAELKKYRKVYYTVQSPGDPRMVGPRVVARLQKSGFDVINVTSNSPGIGVQGSGFVLTSQGHILTCAHVVRKQANATVWIEGVRYPCRVLVSDTNADLALLLADEPHSPFRPLPFVMDTNYVMGQDVYTMGFPLVEVLGTAPRLNKGMISATVGLDDDPKYIQISAPVQPGNSGCPLLNAQAEAIGVVSATLNPIKVLVQSGGDLPQNVNFAIKTGVVRDFLSDSKLTLPATNGGAAAQSFEDAKKSIALVRPGNVSDEDLKQPALVCICRYYSMFDYYWRFHPIQIAFMDLKTGDIVFRAFQRGDGLTPENGQLDRIFEEICDKFFPAQPNPFKGKK